MERGESISGCLRSGISIDTGFIYPNTLFIGGGTPSALSTSELEQLLSLLNERVSLDQVIESTIE